MRTRKNARYLLMAAMLCLSGHVFAQCDVTNHNGGPLYYLGWNAGANQVLEVRNDANQPIEWYTDGVRRMLLQESLSYTIGPFPGQNKDGALLICPKVDNLFSNGAPGPYSLLHLAATDDNAQMDSYRPWMNTGVTFTGNKDHGYVGQKGKEIDYTDMIIHWSDNPGEALRDRMRFLFTSGYDANATYGAQSEEGLEFMRMFPSRFDEPYVGVGDFYAANLVDPNIIEPTERLDIVNGRLRIRDLPEAEGEAQSTYKVMVVDDVAAPSGERGVVKWVDPSVFTGGGSAADCDWTFYGGANGNNLITAYGTSITCPNQDNVVGIGVMVPLAKLHVDRVLTSSTGIQRAGFFSMNGSNGTGDKIGVHATATGAGQQNIGLKGEATGGGTSNFGLHAEANGTGTATSPDTGTRYGLFGAAIQGAKRSYGARGVGGWATQMTCGVRAQADHGPSSVAKPDSIFGVWATAGNAISRSYGVYASTGVASGADGVPGLAYGVYCESAAATGNNVPPERVSYALYAKRTYPGNSHPNNWAGWFDGNVNINGAASCNAMAWTSDANVKTNVQLLAHADSLLALLAPKRYEFLTEQYPDLALSEGEQWGFIAQEVEEVMPELVHRIVVPAFHDSLGNQTQAAMELRTLNYIGIIPLLVAGYQEQRSTIEQQQAMNDALASNVGELQERIEAMEQTLAACCAAPSDGGVRNLSAPADEGDVIPAQERLLRIAPNPFTDRTTLYYNLERAGRAQLLVNSADGRDLRVLSEAQRVAGEYQHEWDTTGLAPGVYYVTLLLDGEPVVKRAVKVQR